MESARPVEAPRSRTSKVEEKLEGEELAGHGAAREGKQLVEEVGGEEEREREASEGCLSRSERTMIAPCTRSFYMTDLE